MSRNQDVLNLTPELTALVTKLQNLVSSETPIKIPNGLSLLSMPQWRELLIKHCRFDEDKRHFGFDGTLHQSDWWDISYDPKRDSSYAYSNTRQPLHTDNAWFKDPSEINFFVMQKQAVSGGEQTILPLSRLIDELTLKSPELLDDLKSVPVIIKKGDDKTENNTTIIADESSIYWNYYRTKRTNQHVDKMCESFFSFLEMLEQTPVVERLHSSTGDCFAFNDTKLLHGRGAFTAQKAGDRLLSQSMWKPHTNHRDISIA